MPEGPFKLVCAFLLGIALTLSFAPFEIFPLAIIAPLAFFYLIAQTKPKEAFLFGYSLGLGFFGSGVYWVYISIYYFANAPLAAAILLTIGFIALLSLFPAITTYLVQRYFPENSPQKWIFAFPGIWVLIEWLRSLLFTGFPWLLIGYSQTHSPLKGYAPILSVYGVSLAVLMSAGLLFTAYLAYRNRHFSTAYRYFFAMISIWILGGLLSLIPWTTPSNEPISVSLVQGNIPQTLKWSSEHVNLSLNRYHELTMPLLKPNHVVIWPEAAVPLPLQAASLYINDLQKEAAKHHANIILGIPIESRTKNGYFNAIITLGTNKQVYLKRRLVPFGEYTPLPRLSA
ncbi:MAG TPA: apolipoprotein N-acyltransferase, partial [Myxococcota bacterium]|nr:apolipoprotein N-acyltransferase [Myxococcota bacterium]